MGNPVFRRPQFSEETTWLPDWLQDSQATASDKLTKETQTKLSNGNVDLKSREDSQYPNCCLFLSGADSSAVSLASPSASVLHLNLHLSSDGNLQYSQSVPCNNYQMDTAKASMSQSEKVRMPFEVGQKTNQLHSYEILDKVNLLTKPTTSTIPETVLKSPCSRGKTHVKRSKDGTHKNDNFDHAVEISVAASEALLIHELLENEDDGSAVVPAFALLDVSLKLKHARLQWVEEDSLSNDQLNENFDYLSDSDDSAMVDAFVDVGLCTTLSGDCCLSNSFKFPLNASPQTDVVADCKFRQSEIPTPEVAVGCTPEKFSEENWYTDNKSEKVLQHEVRYRDGELLVLKCDIGGLQLCTSGQENALLETTELQPCHQHPLSRFNSHWLGGHTKKHTKKYTAKALAVQTSSLSESVDVPDKSSYVDGQESKLLNSVQAGTAVDVTALTNMVEDEMLISPEVAKHSNSLSVDPLCSVVPCSLLSDTPQSVQNGLLFQKGDEDVNKNDLCHASRNVPDSFKFTSELMVKVQGVPTLDDKDSVFNVRKRSASLDKYSVMLPGRNKIRTVPFSHDQFLCQRINGKESCHNNTNKDVYMAPGKAISTAPYFRSSTNFTDPSIRSQPSIGNPTYEVTSIQTICKNSAKGDAGFPTFPSGQEPSVFQMKWIQCLHAEEGLCGDNELNHSASQRVSDDIPVPLQRTTHVPPMKVTCAQDIQVLQRKRVHFRDDEAELGQRKWIHSQKRKIRSESVSNLKSKKLRTSNLQPRETYSQEVKRHLTNYRPCNGDKMIFHGLEFLLTGLPSKKEKEIEQLIIRYGGFVLFDIPPPNSNGKSCFQSIRDKLPIILCLKKVETTKFLYGCAVNACILKVDWLFDSVSAGSVLQPEKYTIFSNQAYGKHARSRLPGVGKLVFEGVGIMFHGKHSFCTKLSRIFKYGGGRVFKSLQWLVRCSERKKIIIQAVVAEDRSMVSRHLTHCAIERNLPVVTASWIINSLHSGELLPFTEKDYNFPKPHEKDITRVATISVLESRNMKLLFVATLVYLSKEK